MLDTLLVLAAGVVIGWHLPQPVWAKMAIDWVKSKVSTPK